MTSTSGRTPHLRWEATPGDWTLVIMAVEPLAPLDVTVTGSVTIPILGPIGIGVLVVAIALLVERHLGDGSRCRTRRLTAADRRPRRPLS